MGTSSRSLPSMIWGHPGSSCLAVFGLVVLEAVCIHNFKLESPVCTVCIQRRFLLTKDQTIERKFLNSLHFSVLHICGQSLHKHTNSRLRERERNKVHRTSVVQSNPLHEKNTVNLISPTLPNFSRLVKLMLLVSLPLKRSQHLSNSGSTVVRNL